ncbi:MAG: methyltransferase domain-containing protein [Sedimentisphaerales bacterium]|nr:methyltransferase domain-containing protein [Sedimentisphaerales bacterium]
MGESNVNDKARSARSNSKAKSAPTKSLGPVPNLEQHVDPEWWRQIFNAMYLKTDGDVVDDPQLTSREVDLFSSVLGISQGDKILDLCCGQGRDVLELARRGFNNVEGLDRSRYLIQRAKAQAKKEGLNVRLREGDARKLPYPADAFDAVMLLGNSFGYFEAAEDDVRVLREVFRVLKPWGKLLIDAADGEYLRRKFKARSWEWIDKNYFVCRERSLSVDKQRLISREVVTHVEKGVVADQFYAERLYTKKSIQEVLEKAGFSEVKIHAQISSDSQRNQDLGMMEKRIVVTSSVRKDWTPRRKKKEFKNITVIFGDPSKPDILKPLCIFDDDDFYTIDQLKDALRHVDGYRYNYLNGHDSLYNDLVKIKGKTDFVFNLCDEGYGNEPRKELHVPALLEVVGIQYTGGGPQCLAFCYDKSLVRGIAKEMEIPVPEAFFIKPEDNTFELSFNFPVIVKPNFGDSSFGITQRSVANTIEELVNAISEIREKFGYDKPILVEEFLCGKDFTVGIIGNPPESYTVLPIIQEDYSMLPPELPRICGYEAKWMPDSPYWQLKSIPADLSEDVEKVVVDCCIKLFERLECRDYARFDWRLDGNGNPKLLEANPNPGWCWDGHMAKMSKIAGISYAEMLGAIIKAAEDRLGIQAPAEKSEPENNHDKSGEDDTASADKQGNHRILGIDNPDRGNNKQKTGKTT